MTTAVNKNINVLPLTKISDFEVLDFSLCSADFEVINIELG